MEAARPRSRRRRQQRSNLETSLESSSRNSEENIPYTEQLDEERLTELKRFQQKLLQQESLLTSKQQKVAQQKEKAKSEVLELFDALHELLERREVELNAEVDSRYDDIENEIEERLDAFRIIRDPVDLMLDKCKFRIGNITKEMLSSLCINTERKLESTKQVDENIPEFVINMDTKNTVGELKYGNFSNDTGHRCSEREDQESTNAAGEIGNTDNAAGSVNGNGRSAAISDEVSEVFEPLDGEDGNREYSRDFVDGGGSFASEQSISGAHSFETAVSGSSEPSAPPLALVDDAEEEADPPPYWEAVGLSGPMENEQLEVVPPLRVSSYSDPSPIYSEFDSNPLGAQDTHNTLELWHSFPLRRQYDVRKPLYVSLSWDDRRICVADRNNRMVKFFSHSGTWLTEMRITSGEIYDIAYLESYDNEARYIATLPKERTLLLLAVMDDNSTKLVKKMVLRRARGPYYSSICRGPRSNTLVGAVTTPTSGAYYTTDKPYVEMFDFDGNVLQAFRRTIDYVEFQYPRSVQVFGDTIFVADWKLNLVAMFLSDGTPVGQYKGTATSPLINPLDLAIDHYGKVFIVDGEFPNIHVVSSEGQPVEVIKVPKSGTDRSQPKLAAFDPATHRLAVVRSNGDLAVFTFRNGYKNIRPGELVLHSEPPVSVPVNESLPYVEGMLPTTIANIPRGRQRSGSREPHFYL